jgi:acetate kinase
VYLGDHTNLTALRDGLPVETTIGFSPVEGIISASACGDIDPTVIFQMQSTGMSLDQIRSILTSRSGITGLLGRPAGMLDVLTVGQDPRMRLAKAVLQYDVVKAIGAFTAVLGGLDVLVFVTPYARQCMSFVTEVCQGLACVGIRIRTGPVAQGASVELTDAISFAKVFCLGYNRWDVLEEQAGAFLKEKGNRK